MYLKLPYIYLVSYMDNRFSTSVTQIVVKTTQLAFYTLDVKFSVATFIRVKVYENKAYMYESLIKMKKLKVVIIHTSTHKHKHTHYMHIDAHMHTQIGTYSEWKR